ncbi:MAG: TauD/TfdA family dioxygenase, partial [Byssovorax sp.]
METAQSSGDTPAKKAVHIPAGSPIKMGYFSSGDTYPLVISPTADGVDLAAWAVENRPFILDALAAHGALLFRGFALGTPLEFENVAGAICSELFGEYGDLPHEDQTQKIYHSTPYPADKAILFHNESSHLPRWPVKQFFFCVQPAVTGGETPLLDCREVYRVLDRDILARFEEKGLMYVRNFCDDIDVPWHEFFKTKDRKEVERICREGGMESEWVRGRTLRIKQRGPAVIKHPRTGEKVF